MPPCTGTLWRDPHANLFCRVLHADQRRVTAHVVRIGSQVEIGPLFDSDTQLFLRSLEQVS